MSNQIDTQDANDVIEYSMDNLTHYWAKDGLPIFVANVPNIIEIVKSLGFSFFYVMGNLKHVEKVKSTVSKPPNKYVANATSPPSLTTATVDVVTYNTKFFKVISNVVGQSIFPVDNVEIDDCYEVVSNTFYDLPKIPFNMIEKLDQFFRTIEASHDSEAIVLLTFDPSFEDSQGWGILVPEQENNAAHCSYDPTSIADNKPDNVYIIGSVHSHPSMPAYASGTDHEDQADFDGLHITFGWQPTVSNNATQYHIEMQMGGKIFTLTPDQVFEQRKSFDPDPEVLQWVTKVKKDLPLISMGGLHSTSAIQTSNQTDSSSKKSNSSKSRKPSSSVEIHYSDLLPDYSLENLGIIIAEVPDKISYTNIDCFCPCCGIELIEEDLWISSCPDCKIPISAKGDPINFIHKIIEDFCLDQNIKITDYKSYLWGFDGDNESWLMEIVIPSSADFDDSFGSISLLEESDSLDIYMENSRCSSCAHFYGTSCPAYALAIEKYNLGTIDYDNSFKTVNGEDCSSYYPFSHSEETSSVQ